MKMSTAMSMQQACRRQSAALAGQVPVGPAYAGRQRHQAGPNRPIEVVVRPPLCSTLFTDKTLSCRDDVETRLGAVTEGCVTDVNTRAGERRETGRWSHGHHPGAGASWAGAVAIRRPISRYRYRLVIQPRRSGWPLPVSSSDSSYLIAACLLIADIRFSPDKTWSPRFPTRLRTGCVAGAGKALQVQIAAAPVLPGRSQFPGAKPSPNSKMRRFS